MGGFALCSADVFCAEENEGDFALEGVFVFVFIL